MTGLIEYRPGRLTTRKKTDCREYQNLNYCRMELIINFTGDFENYMRQKLSENGFKHIPEEVEALYTSYCNVMQRRIAQHKRKIQKSDVFDCPKKLRGGLQRLEKAIVQGENLAWWQSKNILNANYDDKMFVESGIRHFHLGETKENDSDFIVRTGEALYCLVDFQNVYFIEIREHIEKYDAPNGEKLANELLAVAKRNWPHVISRDKNGLSNNMANNAATAAAENLRSILSGYEEYVKTNAGQFGRQVKRIAHYEPVIMEFHLHIDPATDIAYAEELHSKLRFRLGIM